MEIVEAPPMSGDNIPAKELRAEESASKFKKMGWKFYLPVGLLILVVFLLGIGLGMRSYKGKEVPQVVPSPSVSALPIFSPSPQAPANTIEARIERFEKQLQEIDLKEEQLAPPMLDFDIRFEE